MKNNYEVRISKLSKYHGETTQTFTKDQIHEEEYLFKFDNYAKALEEYKRYCVESADTISMPISFNQIHTIQLLDWENTNPNKDRSTKRRVMFQLTISNL